MRFVVVAFVIGALLSLGGCDIGGIRAGSTARVVVGAAVGGGAPVESVSRLGAPTDPVTGQSGVTEAELTVFRGGNQAFYDADGIEVDEVDGTPILLTAAASNRALTLYYGWYDFLVTARDSEAPANDLADGSVMSFFVNADVSVNVPLLSFVGSAELSAPVMVLPNQYFDVFLSVRPPGRPDLRVPTGDYTTAYSFTGATSIYGSSNLGIRLLAVCDEIALEAQVSRVGETNPPTTTTNRVIPVAFACPPVDGTVGIDLIPPYVSVNSHANLETVALHTYITLSGEVNDAQSGVQSVQVYDGVVLIANAVITPPSEAGQPSTWESPWLYMYDERTYDLLIVATDNAGNERHVALQLISASE